MSYPRSSTVGYLCQVHVACCVAYLIDHQVALTGTSCFRLSCFSPLPWCIQTLHLVFANPHRPGRVLADDVIELGVCDGGAVVVRGAAELVEDGERARRSGTEDACRLGDLNPEQGGAFSEVVAGAYGDIHYVSEGQGERVGQDEGAHLGEKGHGAEEGGFAAYVGAWGEVG